MTTLADILKGGANSADAVIIPEGPTASYQGLAREVEQVAGALAGLGIQRGRPISIVLPNGLEFLVTFLATSRAGAVAAPLNPAYTADEFAFYMEDAGSQLAILSPDAGEAREACHRLGVPAVVATVNERGDVALSRNGEALTIRRAPEPPTPDDTALFLHTSGTTSRPKGVPLTHGNILTSLRNIQDTYALSPEDVAMVVMPLFHVHGLIGVALSTLSSGGSIVVPPRFSATSFWEIQKRTGATWYSAVPTIHQILLMRADEDEAPKQSFRFIRSCSSALAPSVFQAMESRFGAPVLEAYGMTEAAHQMASSPLPPGKRVPGTVGKGTGVEIGIMDEKGTFLEPDSRGEVVIRGANVTHGYANNPQANAESFVDGWFRTGDQGFLAEDGYLTLTGRIKELINRGGEKISPLEVDAILLQHPAVSEAVCFAAPDEKYGEVVHAAVVLGDASEAAEIQAFCREHLAAFKVPEQIYIADSLPRTATGKIQRRHVATAFLES